MAEEVGIQRFQKWLNNLEHAITTLLNCFAFFYHGNISCQNLESTFNWKEGIGCPDR
jgi:hypothetical protein